MYLADGYAVSRWLTGLTGFSPDSISFSLAGTDWTQLSAFSLYLLFTHSRTHTSPHILRHSSHALYHFYPCHQIASSSTSRCLRRADSGVPNEALTPRSDTNSISESTNTTSPPERAPSESSSGVHSGEERELEVVIRPRVSCKAPPRPPQPPIQEEPYGRCTNMRMSSFNADPAANVTNSATLPMQRTLPEQKFDYAVHCSTMPLPVGCHSQQLTGGVNSGASSSNGGYASTSAMTSSMGPVQPPPPSQVSSFKTPSMHYANAAVALGGASAAGHTTPHTTLPNGVRYSNPHFLRRLPHVSKAAESPYGHLGYGAAHHVFSKLPHETHPTIPEDRDSANYSMASDQECGLYVTAQLH